MLKATLRLLATTDLHAHAFGWDYHSDRPRDGVGLAGLAHLIEAARRDCPNILLLDNGDFLQGSALGDWAAEAGATGVHPMIAAMNALGYDAATLGNHEFSHGMPLLRQAISDASFPFVSANLTSASATPLVASSVMLERVISDGRGQSRPIAIGITGIAPTQTTVWEAAQIDGQVTALQAVPAAREAVDALRRAGADLVILLAHTGWERRWDREDIDGEMENVAHPLALHAGADAMVLGHTHKTFPRPVGTEAEGEGPRGKLHGKPAVMPGFFGSHLGRIDLSLHHDGTDWHLSETRADLISALPAPAPHHSVETACGPAHEATRQWLGARVGMYQHPLHSYFSRIYPSNIIRLISAAQTDHTHRALRGTTWQHLPLLSAAAPFRAGGRGGAENYTDIPAGKLNLRHVADIYPFPNTVVALLVTGADLADWLERAVIQFSTLIPGGEEVALVDESCPSFDFDLIDDLSFRIDLTRQPRFDAWGKWLEDSRRIKGLTYRGRPVAAADRFVLATNSFRAAGGGGFAGCRPDRIVLDDRRPTRTVLADYLSTCPDPLPPSGFNWSYEPVGTSVTFDSAKKSAQFMADVAVLRPEAIAGAAPDFQRFRLWL